MNNNDDMDEVLKWAGDTEKKRKQEKIRKQEEDRNKSFFSTSNIPFFNILALAGVAVFVGNVMYTANTEDTNSEEILSAFYSPSCAVPYLEE